MPAHWQTVNSYKDRDTLVTVYRPRRSASAGAWVALASVVLAVAVGGSTSDPAGGTPSAPGTSSESSELRDEPTGTNGTAEPNQPNQPSQPGEQSGVAGPVTAVVRSPGGLPVRAQADMRAAEVGHAPENSSVTLACHIAGPPVHGRSRTSEVWVRMTAANGASGYVPDVWLATRGDVRSLVPPCTEATA